MAQVKIGENPETIDQGSLLELESTTRTLVLTRISESQMQSLTPTTGALVYNTDSGCIFYFDGVKWVNLCGVSSGIQFNENGDGTFTLDIGNGFPITFNGSSETITSIADNGDGSYTYINESGEETVISINGAANISFNDLNGDGTFTLDDGTNPPITINSENETITLLLVMEMGPIPTLMKVVKKL